MNKIVLIIVLSISLFMISCPSSATVILEDGFDDGALNPSWSVMLGAYASAWSYNESGGKLTVTDITPTPITDSKWSQVYMYRSFAPLTDFHVDFDFSWDSENSPAAMQSVFLYLLADNFSLASLASPVAWGGYDDAWNRSLGQKVAAAGEGIFYQSNPGSLPYSGTASVDISRSGDNIEFYWDGAQLTSGSDSHYLVGVAVVFKFYDWNGSYPSFFGSESLDLIKVDGTLANPVPEPATLLLVGSGIIGLAGIRKRLRKGQSG